MIIKIIDLKIIATSSADSIVGICSLYFEDKYVFLLSYKCEKNGGVVESVIALYDETDGFISLLISAFVNSVTCFREMSLPRNIHF